MDSLTIKLKSVDNNNNIENVIKDIYEEGIQELPSFSDNMIQKIQEDIRNTVNKTLQKIQEDEG